MDSDSSSKSSRMRISIADVFPMIVITSDHEDDGGTIPEKSQVRRGSAVNATEAARASENLSLGVANDKIRRSSSFVDLKSATSENGTAKPGGGAQLSNGLDSKPKISRTKSATCLPTLNSENEPTKSGGLFGTNPKSVEHRDKSVRTSLEEKQSISRSNSPAPLTKQMSLGPQDSRKREPSPSGTRGLLPEKQGQRSRSPSPYGNRVSLPTLGVSVSDIRDRGHSPGRISVSSVSSQLGVLGENIHRRKSFDKSSVNGEDVDGRNGRRNSRSYLEELEPIQAELEKDLEKPEVEKILKNLKANHKEMKYMSVDFCPLKRSDSKKSLVSVGSSSSEDNVGDSQIVKSAYWKEFWTNSSTGSEQNQIKTIRGMCFTSKGFLAVTEEKNGRVQIFTRSGKSVKILKGGSNLRRMQPGGICQSPNQELVAVTDLSRIVYLDPAQDQWELSVPFKDKTDLVAIGAAREGKILLTETGKKPSVGIYEASGEQVRKFKAKDFGIHLKNPNCITSCTDLGLICFADCELGSVFILDQDGKLVTQFGQQGIDAVRLVYPKGISYLSNGRIAVVDRALNRMLVYDLRSRSVDHMLTSSHGLQSPCAMAYDGRGGYLAIAEENQDWKLDEYKLKMFKQRI